jgi:hypothetical protein
MGHKSHNSRRLREMEIKTFESSTLTETSLASLIKMESEKIQDLLKKNASTDTLLESSKIFSQTVYNIALAELIPLLKNDKNLPTTQNLLNQSEKTSTEQDMGEDFEPSEDSTKPSEEPKPSIEAGSIPQPNVVSSIFSILAQYLTNNSYMSSVQNQNSIEK